MFEYYIKKIHIGQLRHLEDVDIPVCENECRHLILTGRNGSGKTSLLEAMREYFNFVYEIIKPSSKIKGYYVENNEMRATLDASAYNDIKELNEKIQIDFNKIEGPIPDFARNDINSAFWSSLNVFEQYDIIAAFFADERRFSSPEPGMIEKVGLKQIYTISERPGELFLKYLVDMKATEAFSKNKGNEEKALKICEWFDKLEKLLQRLFCDNELKLIFDESTFKFFIKESDGRLFDFNTMSAGYSAAFDIIVDLMMRMEATSNKSFCYDRPGIVLIDEIETHLHLELQKLILPMLTELFPNIQFIVSTHSPFVINSIENATIFDLEKKTLVPNGLGNIPYEGVIDGYFNVDRLSAELRSKFDEYKILCKKKNVTDLDFAKAAELEAYLDEVPDYLAIDFAEEYSRKKLEFHKRKGGQQ